MGTGAGAACGNDWAFRPPTSTVFDASPRIQDWPLDTISLVPCRLDSTINSIVPTNESPEHSDGQRMQQPGLLDTLDSVQRPLTEHDQVSFAGQCAEADVPDPGPGETQTQDGIAVSSSLAAGAVVPQCSCMKCAFLGTYNSITWTKTKRTEDWDAVFSTLCRIPDCTKRIELQTRYFNVNESKKLQYDVVSHERTHYGQPGAYRCLEAGCQVTAKKFYDLRRHYRGKHCSNVVKYPCKELGCRYSGDNGFVRKDKLKDHQRNVHGGRANPAKSLQPLKPKMEEVERQAEGIAQPRKRAKKE